jgi:hypothetical protein
METHPIGSKRWTRQGLAVALMAGLVSSIGLAACSSGTSNASPFSGKTPAQVLTMAKDAALARGSVHLVGNYSSSGGGTVQNVYDAATTQGKQVATSSPPSNGIALLMSPQMAYIQGDASFLEDVVGMGRDDAMKYAGQWIAVPSSSSEYANAASGLTISELITNVTPTGTLSFAKPTTIDGKTAVGVSGGLPVWANGSAGTTVLYVSTAAPYLPVAEVVQGTNGTDKMTGTDHMSDYGKPVTVTAPATSIPITSIMGA